MTGNERFDGPQDNQRVRASRSGDAGNPFDAEARANGVVTRRDRDMLRRIRIKALLWSALCASLVAGAVITYRSALYPWFGWSAFAVLLVAATYLVGWSRGSKQLAAADDGDEIACRYTLEGPVFGSIEWWWSASPVVHGNDRRKLAIMGGMMAVLTLTFAVLAWFVRGFWPVLPLASLMIAVPPLIMAVVCFRFLFRPSESAVRGFVRARWLSLGFIVLAATVLAVIGHDDPGFAQALGVFALLGTLISSCASALRNLAVSSMQRPRRFVPQRGEIDAQLRRMAASDPQTALDGTAMEQVNRRRERRLFWRAAGIVALLALLVVADVVVRYYR